MDMDNRCYKCGKGEYEPAGENCTHPSWHVPPRKPEPPPEPVENEQR